MSARAICGVVLAMVSGCGSPKPAFDVAEVCAGKDPGGEVMVFRMHEPGAENLAYDLRLALTQQPESAARDAAIAELDIFRVAIEADRVFSRAAAEHEQAIRYGLTGLHIWFNMTPGWPGLVRRLANREDLAEPMRQLLADEQAAQQLGQIRESVAAGTLAGAAGTLATKASELAEIARRATVDGDPAQAEPTLVALSESMQALRKSLESDARILKNEGDMTTIEGTAKWPISRPLKVWIDLIIVTALLADRWPDSIGAARQRAFEAPRRGWAVTCIAPTTAALPAEFGAAMPTLVAARDTLGAALAIVPTTAPSPPPTADALLAVLPPRN